MYRSGRVGVTKWAKMRFSEGKGVKERERAPRKGCQREGEVVKMRERASRRKRERQGEV